ncbi:MAG: DUF58 domain-containing protein [Termitinemataceae bacterium]|nr:MAG: DUF58 domain-containing protein [Termitinemataceae bacterium]
MPDHISFKNPLPQARVSPGRSLFIASAVSLVLGTASFFVPFLLILWKTAGILTLALAAVDCAALFFFTDRLKITRTVNTSLSLGVLTPVTITVSRSRMKKRFIPVKFKVFDLFDDSMQCDVMPLSSLKLKPSADGWIFTYNVRPIMRGDWEFSGVHLLLSSILRFWRLKVVHNTVTTGKTYPNFSILTKHQSLQAILQQGGEKNIHKRGSGMEFDSLRDWQNGDTVRSVDWRSTSRRKKVTVRQYQEEQDQNVLLLLDSGYRLHRKDGELQESQESQENESGLLLTQFDFALNAALLLAWSALKTGDSVAAGVFGNSETWQPPRKGLSAFKSLMNSLYGVQSTGSPSSPAAALQNAASRLKRRTFIALISNFRKEDEEQIRWVLPQITSRHLLMMVSLRETDAEKLSASDSLCNDLRSKEDNILERTATYAYLKERAALYKKWEHSGILTLEAAAGNLSTALVNRYLAVKRSGLL